VFEVRDMTEDEVSDFVERTAAAAVQTVLKGQGLTFRLPARTGNNHYVPELDSNFLESANSRLWF